MGLTRIRSPHATDPRRPKSSAWRNVSKAMPWQRKFRPPKILRMDAPSVVPTPAPPQQPKLLDLLRQRIRVLHYSIRTEQAYVDWARRFIQSHALFTGIYFLKRLFVGFLVFAGLRLLVLRQFSAFLPALRRFRGTLLFRGLRSSSIWGFPFWLLWLTGQSSRPAFGRRLTFVR